MNDFETTLRSTLDDDIAGDHHAMTTDVRRGVRRRRNRRRAIVAGAAAVVLVAGSLGAARFLTDGGPEAADGSGATSPTHVREMASSDEGLLVASYEDDCECTVLWRQDGDDWERLRTMSGTSLWLSMAPNGTDGIMMRGEYGSAIEVTHDGGGTWAPLDIQGTSPDDTDGGELGVWASDEYFWVVEGGYSSPDEQLSAPRRATTAWRGPSGGASVTQIELPDFAPRSVWPLGQQVIAVRRDEPGTTPFVSSDAGATWQQASWPCRTDSSPGSILEGRALHVLCDSPSSDQVVVHRTTDMMQWEIRGRRPDSFMTWSLGPDRSLLVTSEGVLLAGQEGVIEIDLAFEPDLIRHVAGNGQSHYLATSQDIYESTDGGETWEKLED